MNLQLDHFSDDIYTHNEMIIGRVWVVIYHTSHIELYSLLRGGFRRWRKEIFFFFHPLLEQGQHNVSRWMTWLPISLKNAAKCDKWYQLQNHSITESLNAKGAREKLFTSHTRAYRNSQCRTSGVFSKIQLSQRGPGEKKGTFKRTHHE